MMRLRHKILIHAFRLSDQFSLWAGLVFAVAVFGGRRGHEFIEDFAIDYHPMSDFMAVALLALIWAWIFGAIVRYDTNRFTSFGHTVVVVLKATTVCSFLLLGLATLFKVEMISQYVVLGHWAAANFLILSGRGVIRILLKVLRRSGYNRRNVVFVGVNERSLRLAGSIESKAELGYHIQGFVLPDDAPEGSPEAIKNQWSVVSRVGDFQPYLEKGIVDEVMVCLPLEERIKEVFAIFRMCQELGIVVRIVPDSADARVMQRAQVEELDGEHLVTFFREKMLWQLLAKRVLDLTVASVMLLLLSPMLLVVAIIIKVTSPGPVFFTQIRVGMNKRKFTLFKFRSMVADAEQRKAALASMNEIQGPAFKMKNDPRITNVGRFIRKTSIDELPQLWNVIKGEMSLVGPRPPLPNEVDQYEWLDRRRLSIKPGITCLWQVGGRSNLSFEQWMELDRLYCDTWSFWLDIKILLKTIPAVLFARGAA